jgi:hypothetical protein
MVNRMAAVMPAASLRLVRWAAGPLPTVFMIGLLFQSSSTGI